MTRSALIDMAVREAMTKVVLCDQDQMPDCPLCKQNIYYLALGEWPRLLASHPIDTQGGSHD
jgi:hypothetical protein